MKLGIWSGHLVYLLVAVCLSIASFVAHGKDGSRTATGVVQILPTGDCKLADQAIECNRVARRLKSQHRLAGDGITVFADDAPYETVIALLDSIREVGIDKVDVFPPFLGTNPSRSLKHWIKLVPEGQQNHIFWKVMISTQNFRNWGETLVVLSESDFAIVDRLATSGITQVSCAAKKQDIPKDLQDTEHRLILIEHADELTQSCLFPRAATSCDFLSTLVHLPNVHWRPGDLDGIGKVVSEIGCNTRS